MDELFLYDRDEGLFKQILLKSKVMQGRYFVLSSGFDINNVGPDNPLTGQKYPCVACLPPTSDLQQPELMQENIPFTLYFLTRSGVTGQNQIKSNDPYTNTSDHPVWYDWKDMKEVAAGFIRTLREIIRKRMVGEIPLRGLCSIDIKVNPRITRISNAGSDKVSGVKMTFAMILNDGCANDDYAGIDLSTIAVPDLTIHPLHKH